MPIQRGSTDHAALTAALRLASFPSSRYMGSKHAILPFLAEVFQQLPGETVLDAFSGSAAVSYLLKTLGRTVLSNDYLAIAYHTANACVANNDRRLPPETVERLLAPHPQAKSFIRDTFAGLYFTDDENKLLDHLLARVAEIDQPVERSLAIAAITRACLRRRARGVFTYTGSRYDDGRADLRRSLAEQIRLAIDRLNAAIFDTGRPHRAFFGDVFALPADLHPDIVYIDPPYVSPHSDNDYTRRYHFVEGFARGWQGLELQLETTTRKFRRLPSRFDRKSTIYDAFAALFVHYAASTLVVSYSSNCLPTKDEMIDLLRTVKRRVTVHEHDHRYSFGTHRHKVGLNHNAVAEYLFVAT